MERDIYRELEDAVLTTSGDGHRVMGYFNDIPYIGRELSKDDLINIIKELDYAAYYTVSKDKYNEIIETSMMALEPEPEEE